MYMLGSKFKAPSVLDMIAYSSYKFVNVVVNVFIFILFGLFAYYVTAAITGVSMLLFVVYTMQKRLVSEDLVEHVTVDHGTVRIFLLLSGIVQPAVCLFLGVL